MFFEKSLSSALLYTSRPYSEAMTMRPAVTYTPYVTSPKEQTGDVITFTQFEEGNILTETRNDAESCDESDSESLMMNGDEKGNCDHNIITTDTLEDIRDRNQTDRTVNKREARCKIRDHIKQRQLQWKGAVKATRNMGKCLHKLFSTIVKEILQELINLGESGSEVSHFIPEPRNFAEVTKLS